MRRPRGKTWLGLAPAGLLVLLTAGVAWGLVAYVGLVGLEVEIEDACARVEAESRARAELAANLIHGARLLRAVDAERLNRVGAAAERAAAPLLSSAFPDQPDRYRAFLSAQNELKRELAELWPALRATGGGTEMLAGDLAAGLDEANRAMNAELERLSGCVAAYRAAVGRFPGSVVASIAGVDGRTRLGSLLPASTTAIDVTD